MKPLKERKETRRKTRSLELVTGQWMDEALMASIGIHLLHFL